MTLVRWDPLQELVRWSTGTRVDDAFGAWAPAVDIYEKGHDLVIRAEVPGIDKNDIAVDIENGVLTLRGERKRETEVSEQNAYRLERTYGTFTRSFSLPTTVDPSKVVAVYKDGVLELTVPKLEAAKPKKIEIRAA
ncbi:MAG TPA: Hsp20/alpha crystallin family protein [Candidatus Sulfotelmatobacter sp.]|jgi:HSP20 family protein|nr:Hsp20/alpha crystallin family protein [Candidatus Sulfotelmatobacter sp.]